jgi:ATP-dependent Clp protease ATP-binding subunit ClpA
MTVPDHSHVQSLPRRPYVTTRTHEVFALALRRAERLGHDDVTAGHIALALLEEGQNLALAALHFRGVPLDVVARELEADLPPATTPRVPAEALSWTPGVEAVLQDTIEESRTFGVEYHGCEHLLLALLRNPASAPARVLARHGVGYDEARAEVVRIFNAQPTV